MVEAWTWHQPFETVELLHSSSSRDSGSYRCFRHIDSAVSLPCPSLVMLSSKIWQCPACPTCKYHVAVPNSINLFTTTPDDDSIRACLLPDCWWYGISVLLSVKHGRNWVDMDQEATGDDATEPTTPGTRGWMVVERTNTVALERE